ncbi:wax ester/triacylglycerol synthase domain-containing protein [Leifsonia xyli]|uniref:wax ester/triacylglycerol synthase domain-containing protein n=1 Tax=Leifsonia xyli TaxID=1575 RepID=UPI003D66A798
MAAVDAANLALERGQPNVVTLAGLLAPGGFVDGGGIPDAAALRDALAPRIERVAALRRFPQRVGSGWTWQNAAPDLTEHIRVIEPEAADPARPDATVFERTCARVVMTPLAAGGPLWELLLVPRAAERRCGVIFRLHHAVADGLGAEALIGALADPDADPAGAAAGPVRRPSEPTPTPHARRSLPGLRPISRCRRSPSSAGACIPASCSGRSGRRAISRSLTSTWRACTTAHDARAARSTTPTSPPSGRGSGPCSRRRASRCPRRSRSPAPCGSPGTRARGTPPGSCSSRCRWRQRATTRPAPSPGWRP